MSARARAQYDAAHAYIRTSVAAVHQAMQCPGRFPDSLSKWKIAAEAWFVLLRLCDDEPEFAWSVIEELL